MKYKLIRSNRKTLSLEITPDGSILVRSPYRASKEQIDDFVLRHTDWIQKHLAIANEKQKQAQSFEHLSMDDIRELGNQALKVIPQRVRYYAPIMGVTYGKITIRNQTTRWGSCSAKGNLNFNCLLMLMPQEIVDYVVVHELAHRIEMNHSPAFWAIVESVLPDYRQRRQWLKDNGAIYMQRMTG